ncbi:MAG: sulfur transferase domain-containing protein [Gammaproteobacteria bacterium]
MPSVQLRIKSLAVATACLLLVACGTLAPDTDSTETSGISPGDVSAPEAWGAAKNVTTLKFLSFSGQPDAETFRVAKTKGITTVLNLRHSAETRWNGKENAEKLGLNYINIPISRTSDSLDPAAINAIGDVIEQQEGSPILLYCASGNRVAAWLATHLIDDHNMSVEGALSVARRAGMTRRSTEKRVFNYINR